MSDIVFLHVQRNIKIKANIAAKSTVAVYD